MLNVCGSQKDLSGFSRMIPILNSNIPLHTETPHENYPFLRPFLRPILLFSSSLKVVPPKADLLIALIKRTEPA